MSKKKKKKKLEAGKNKIDLIEIVDRDLARLFVILIVVLPLLVRAKVIDFTSPRIITSILNTGLQADEYYYYKWIFMICMAVITITFLLFKMAACNYKLRASYINVPLLILVVFILLSYLTAEYKSIALVGLYNQDDGAITYLCYFALFFTAANTIFKESFYRYITAALGIFIIINLTIILCNFYGHDLFQLQIIRSIVIPSDLWQYMGGQLFTTLEHPNYLSGFAAALFAFFLTLALLEIRVKQRLFYMAGAVSSFVLALAALSSSGFVSIVIIIPVFITMASLSQERRQTLIIAGATLVLCGAFFFIMNAHNPDVSGQTTVFIRQMLTSAHTTPQSGVLSPTVNIALATSYKITPSQDSSNLQVAPTAQESGDFNLPKPGWSAGTGRTYIWKETLSLIKARPFSGYGQDTLAYYFPHNDINHIANLHSYNMYITKPHNMYLDIAFGSGIPALLSLFALFFMHLYYTARRLIREKRTPTIIFPAALFSFSCAFMVQWLFNDSVIGSSAIFWTLLGVGVSLNLHHSDC